MITQRMLMQIVDYDPDTGVFLWKVQKAHATKIGSIAGSADVRGYWRIHIDGKSYKAHRLAWLWVTGTFPTKQIDHVDGNKANNRWRNLRECTGSQNRANCGKPSTNTSGFKGVNFHRGRQQWQARIMVRGRRVFLGWFDEAESARDAYQKAAVALCGDFARAT